MRQEPVRITTVFRKLVAVSKLFVAAVQMDEERGFVLEVRPSWKKPRCGKCGRKAPQYDQRPVRYWRHLALGRFPLWVTYAPRRVSCPRCDGVVTEQVPWAPQRSGFTWDFEELVAYLAQVTDKTQVTKLMGISWETVGAIVERVVARRLDPERLNGLCSIGIDEFSYRKRHRYLTTVVDHDRCRVVWAHEGRSGNVLERFFDELGSDRCLNISNVTIDMAEGYINAVKNRLPQAQIVFDRFHVQKLASDAIDKVRRSMVREATDPDESRAIKRSRFALLKNPWDLRPTERRKLSEIQEHNKRLYRAYLLKETLAQALDYQHVQRAREALEDWLSWASRSKLKPFVKAARTVRKHLEGIVAYVRTRLTNGLVEGLNNKLRVVTRRAYGFHSAGALISMLFLTCGGVQLDPPLPEKYPFSPTKG